MSIERIYFGGPQTTIDSHSKIQHTSKGTLYLVDNANVVLEQIENPLSTFDLESDIKLKDDVSTDAIIRVTDLIQEQIIDLAPYALNGLGKAYGFRESSLINSGKTVLVAGGRFGSGSSREQAVWSLQESGITAVIAKSFGPIFEKNAVYNGLLTSNDTGLADMIQRGDPIPFSCFLEGKSPLMKDILQSGGLFRYLSKVNSGEIEHPNFRYKDRNEKAPMNIWQQRLSKVSGNNTIRKDDSLVIPVDTAYSYDVLSVPAFQLLQKEYGNIEAGLDSSNIYLFEDHFAYSSDTRIPRLVSRQRELAKYISINEDHYYKGKVEEGGGKGISHRVMLEKLDPRTNKVVVCTDSHTPTIGALPLLGLPVGSTLFASALAEAQIPVSVNGVMRVEFKNQIPRGLSIRDVQLQLAHLAKDIPGGLVIEFGGMGLNTLSFEQVVALCNMVPEIFNAELAVTESFEAGIQFLSKLGIDRETAETLYGKPDDNCSYEYVLQYDLALASPVVSLPGSPKNTIPLSELSHTKIDKAFLVSCTLGLRDLAEAAAMIKGKKVSDGIELIITPSSETVRDQAETLGILSILSDAGGTITGGSACGACIGEGMGSLKEGEVAITSSNRNFPGRMGHIESKSYMAGPQLTALAAILGHIPSVQEWQRSIDEFESKLKEFDAKIGIKYPEVSLPVIT